MSPPISGLIAGSLVLAPESATCRVCFTSEEPFFAGHFPGHPIVPGMMTLSCLVALAQTWLQHATPVQRIVEAKFRHEVGPGVEMTCHVHKVADDIIASAEAGGSPVVEVRFVF